MLQKYFKEKIISYQEIIGHYNQNFKVTTIKGVFHLKILKDKKYEIRPWINGSAIDTWNEDAIKKVCQKLLALHQTQQHWQGMDFFKIEIEDQKYKALVKKYKGTYHTPCHNDLNKDNIILDGAQAHLIDFEFKRLNNYHWDVANIINEDNLNQDQIKWFLKYYPLLNKTTLQDFIYINKVFTTAWKQKYLHKKT